MAKISQLPLLSTTSGNETLVVLKDGVTQRAPLDALAGGATARDAFTPLMQILGREALGRVTYSGGARRVERPKLIVAELGNSLSNAEGASSPDLSPGMQLVKKLRARLPNCDVELDRYAVNGSWVSQYEARINSFTRTPHIAVVVGGSNDAIANIFMGYQGFVGGGNTYGGFEGALERVFQRLRKLGCVVVNCTAPLWHPVRSLERGRMTVTPEVLMTWPVTSLIAFYLRIVFTKADQRITAYAVDAAGKLVPFDLFNRYGNGLLTVGSYLLEFNPNGGTTGQTHRALEFGADGSWVRVDGTITADKNDGVTSIRQCAFDNQTQVMPPMLAEDGVEGAIVQRDMGNGVLVDVPSRLWEINRLSRRVASRNNIVTVDWEAAMGRLVYSMADYDRIFTTSKPIPTADDLHPGDEGYLVLDRPLDRLVDDMVHGVAPSLVYGPTSSANDNEEGDGGGDYDARIEAVQNTANTARTDASAAKTASAEALTTAGAARTDATAAKGTAGQALTAAGAAQSDAGAAKTTAGEALTIANAAKTDAGAAKVTAGNAVTVAEAASADATDAKSTAAEALSGQASLAPLASPVLTGVPTAPTAAAGTKTDQLATTLFVSAAVSALMNGAPGALDTLNELAAAMGNDPNFAATMTNLIAQKQPLLGFTPLSTANNLADLGNKAAARDNLGAAAKGTNADITEITGLAVPLSVTQGGTGDSTPEWTTYTPAYTAQTGAMSVAYCGGRYKKIGKTVHLTAHLRPVFPGNAAGEARISLPFPAINLAAADGSPFYFQLTCYDEGIKIPLRAVIMQGGTTVRITKLDGTTPFNANSQMYVTGTYEAA